MLALITAFGPAHDLLVRVIGFAKPIIAAHPVAGALAFVSLAMVSSLLMFVSSVALVPVGVDAWGAPVTALLLWIGWFIGGILTYSVGRHLGRRVVGWMLSRTQIARYEDKIPKDAPFTSALCIQMAVPSDVAGYFFGLVSYPWQKFLLALAIAELPYALLAAYVGAALIDRSTGLLIGGALVGIAVAAWLLHGGWGSKAR